MSVPTVRHLTELALDAVYVTVGFGVIAADRLRGRRRELSERLGIELPDLRDRLRPRDESPHASGGLS